MKKLLSLGGNYFQMTAVKTARELGIYVIDVDNVPDNPAHEYANEYHNISIVEKEKVLELAKRLNIDGIISYASDIGAVTAAYVAEKMGLPTNPYDSVELLTNKAKFREFLEKNGYNVPLFGSFEEECIAQNYASQIGYPVIVKPVDSSGSKGVNKVSTDREFQQCFSEALKYSKSKTVIVEKFLERKEYQIDGDAFLFNENDLFFAVMDQHKDYKNAPYTPIGHSIPSCQNHKLQNKAYDIVFSILKKLKMKMGAFNIEYIVLPNNEIQIMEIGPRNGGNLISDAIKYSTGMDLIKATVFYALNIPFEKIEESMMTNRYISSYIIHSNSSGIYNGLSIKEKGFKILEKNIWIKYGDRVDVFKNSSMGIGAAIIEFESVESMCNLMDCMDEYISVVVV